MIRLLKRLLQAMIEIGNTIITAITIGASAVQKIDWGNDQVWPVQENVYLVITGATATTVDSGYTGWQQQGYVYISASTNDWSASSDQTWVSAAKDNGSRATYWVTGINQTIETRDAYLTFSIDNVPYDTFKITQKAARKRLIVSPTTLTGLTDSSSSGTINVTTNLTSWGAWVSYKTPNTNWIGVTANTSTNKVNWSVTQNTSEETRSAEITVSGMGISTTINVTQNAGNVFYLSPVNTVITSAATAYTVTVNSRNQGVGVAITSGIVENSVNATVELISSTPSVGNYVYRVSAPQRTSIQKGALVINYWQNGAGTPIQHRMEQSGAVGTLTISPTGMTNISSAGTSASFSVSTNASSWSWSKTGNWFTATKSGDNLNISVPANSYTAEQTGSVVFTAGSMEVTAPMKQQAKYVQPSISGVTVKATYGDWVLGYYYTGGHGGPYNDPIVNIIVAKMTTFSENHTATISMTYTDLTRNSHTVTDQTYGVTPSTISIPNAGTCNGYVILGGQLNLDNVTRFEVS